MPQPVSTTETWANLGMLAEPGHQGYRRQERAALMGFVPYEMREFLGEDSIVIHQGEALSLNISDGGMLLMMDQAPPARQVFELHMPASTVVRCPRWSRSVGPVRFRSRTTT